MPRRPEPYTSEYFLLGLIQAQPIYPYDLHKRLSEDEELRLIWRFNQSQLYATLEKLEKAGLIWAADSDYLTFPARKVYSITGVGADRFEEWLAAPVAEQRNLRRDFLMKLFFLMKAPLTEYRDGIALQIDCCRSWLAQQELYLADLPDDAAFQRAVLQFRARTTRAHIDWLCDCLKLRADENAGG